MISRRALILILIVGVLVGGLFDVANAYRHPNTAGWIAAFLFGFCLWLCVAGSVWVVARAVKRWWQQGNQQVDRLVAPVRKPAPRRRPDGEGLTLQQVVEHTRDPGCDVRRSTTWTDRDRGGRRTGRNEYLASNGDGHYFTYGGHR